MPQASRTAPRALRNASGESVVVENMTSTRVAAAKVVLAVATIVLLISQIGFVLVPLLAPAHLWAARRCTALGRWLWTLLPALGLGALAWAAVYVSADEPKPAIWLLPAAAVATAWIGLRRVAETPRRALA